MENNVHDPNYEMMQDNEWTYDDTERTAVCVSEDVVTEKIWYDEQQRVLRDEYYTPDGILQTCTVNDFLTLPDKSGNILQIPNVKYNAAIRKQRAQYPKQRKNH